MNKLKVYMLLTLALAFVAITSCEKKELNGLEIIKKRGFIQVAVSGDDPPFGYIDDKGKNRGFEITFAKRLAKELLGDSTKIEFIIVDPGRRFEVLINERADIVLANFTHTHKRAQILDFAHSYMKVSISVVSPKTAPIRDVSELKDKKLIVSKGSTSEEYFYREHPEIEIMAFEQVSEIFQALKDGRGAALAEGNAVAFVWAQENTAFEVGISSLGPVEGIAPAIRKENPELLDFINKTIEKLVEEQFFHKNFEANLRTFMGSEASPEDFVFEGAIL
jgi:polar amino acid transport system substrate-binding protein